MKIKNKKENFSVTFKSRYILSVIKVPKNPELGKYLITSK